MGKTLYMSRVEIKEFMASIETLDLRKMSVQQTQLLFLVLLKCAGRISEILSLTPEDLLPDGRLRFRFAKGGWERCKCSEWRFRPLVLVSSNPECKKCQGKGKYRVNQYGWVDEETFKQLKELAEGTDSGQRLFPITRRQALNYVNDLANARTHTFRHTWLTWLYESTKDLRDVKVKARHTSLATTDRYIETNQFVSRKKEDKLMELG